MSAIIRKYEEKLKQDRQVNFRIGDTVRVPVKIIEGSKERIQKFEGIVIAIQGGGLHETFTVRRLVAGIGVERTFLFHSPRIGAVEVLRKSKVRRAKLYYLRDRIGSKATRLQEDKAATLEISRLLKEKRAKALEQKKAAKEEEAKKKELVAEKSSAPK